MADTATVATCIPERKKNKALDRTFCITQRQHTENAVRCSDYVNLEHTNYFMAILLSNLNATFKACDAVEENPHLQL